MSPRRDRLILLLLLVVCGLVGLWQRKTLQRPVPAELCQRSRSGQAWETVHRCTELLQSTKDRGEVWDERASALVVLGDYPRALSDYNQLVKTDDSDMKARLGRGRVCQLLGRTSEARADFEVVTGTKDPDSWSCERSLALEALGRQPEAQEVIRNSRDKDQLYLYRGLFLLDFDPSALERELAHTIPKDADQWGLLAYAQVQSQHFFSAINSYRRALDFAPSSQPRRVNLAWALYLNGELETALKLCQEPMPQGRLGLSMRETRAHIYLDQGRVEEALADLNWILAEVTQNPFYYEVRAEAYGRLGQSSKAQADLVRALELRRF